MGAGELRAPAAHIGLLGVRDDCDVHWFHTTGGESVNFGRGERPRRVVVGRVLLLRGCRQHDQRSARSDEARNVGDGLGVEWLGQ